MTSPAQTPGCLPAGFDMDSMLTPAQFCTWQNVSRQWFSSRLRLLPGVCKHSRQMVRIHPRTYLAAKPK